MGRTRRNSTAENRSETTCRPYSGASGRRRATPSSSSGRSAPPARRCSPVCPTHHRPGAWICVIQPAGAAPRRRPGFLRRRPTKGASRTCGLFLQSSRLAYASRSALSGRGDGRVTGTRNKVKKGSLTASEKLCLAPRIAPSGASYVAKGKRRAPLPFGYRSALLSGALSVRAPNC